MAATRSKLRVPCAAQVVGTQLVVHDEQDVHPGNLCPCSVKGKRPVLILDTLEDGAHNGLRLNRSGPFPGGPGGRTLTMIELLVTYPGLVFIGLSLLVVLDTVSGNLPPAALVPFALGTVVAVILL